MPVPPPVGPYTPVRRVGDFLYCSGQIGMLDGTLADGFDAQARQVLQNMTELLASVEATLGHIVKTTVFLTDMSNYSAMNSIYGEYFSSNPPARSAVAVAALPAAALIEIEAIAYVG